MHYKIRKDVEVIAREKFLNKYFSINFDEVLPYRFYTYAKKIKAFLMKELHEKDAGIFSLKNLLLPYMDKILQGENIVEVLKAEAIEKPHIKSYFYIKTKLFPERYFVIELRKEEQTLNIYTINTLEDILRNYFAVLIYPTEKE